MEEIGQAKRAIEYIIGEKLYVDASFPIGDIGYFFSIRIREEFLSQVVVGPSGYFFSKKTGLVSPVPYFMTTDEAVEAFELGVSGMFDLRITGVKCGFVALRMLNRVGLTFSKEVKESSGQIREIREQYSMEQLREKLSSLPAFFEGQSFAADPLGYRAFMKCYRSRFVELTVESEYE